MAVSFDFRGHGASDGCRTLHTIHDVGAALAWLQAQPGVDPARIAVRGSSMGGYFAIHALRRWPELACGVALNPPDEAGLNRLMRDARDPTTFFGEWRARGEGFPRLMGCDWRAGWSRATSTRPPPSAPPGRSYSSTAGAMRWFPWEITERICVEACEPKTCWVLEGGDHRFASHDPDVRARMLDWLAAAI